jgi:hypothetical protein
VPLYSRDKLYRSKIKRFYLFITTLYCHSECLSFILLLLSYHFITPLYRTTLSTTLLYYFITIDLDYL